MPSSNDEKQKRVPNAPEFSGQNNLHSAEESTKAELISRSVALKLIEQTGTTANTEGMSAEFWIAQVKDVFNFLYSRIGLPLELRNFIDALIGASNGRTDWFECSDKALAVRLIGDAADGKTPNALKKKIQRLRKKMIDWQCEHSYVLVEVDIGYAESRRDEAGEIITYSDGSRELEYHPTRYRLPILPHAKRVLLEAFSNPNRLGDVSLVAKRLLGLLREEPKVWDSAGRTDELRQLRRFKSMGKTSFKKAIELERKQGGNPRKLLMEAMKEIEIEAILPSDPVEAVTSRKQGDELIEDGFVHIRQ